MVFFAVGLPFIILHNILPIFYHFETGARFKSENHINEFLVSDNLSFAVSDNMTKMATMSFAT